MDMGWGVTYQETYSHLLQEWLNEHGRRTGLGDGRRFEVLNFAVAAYSPLQRLESFRRKALAFHPDLVVFSATMLDLRLMEIHLCDALRSGADLTYDFVKSILDRAGVRPEEYRVDGEGRLVSKDQIKAKLRPYYWELYDATLGALAGECRAAGDAARGRDRPPRGQGRRAAGPGRAGCPAEGHRRPPRPARLST